jgi:hypothetical protein
MSDETKHSEQTSADTDQDWFTIGRWWSEMPSAGPGLKRRMVGRLLQLRGLIQSPKPGRICLVHTGRTGSTVLANMLRAHPDLYWDDETLGRRTRWFMNEHPNAHLGPRPAQSPVGEVARRFWRASGSRFGFEVKPMHHEPTPVFIPTNGGAMIEQLYLCLNAYWLPVRLRADCR